MNIRLTQVKVSGGCMMIDQMVSSYEYYSNGMSGSITHLVIIL